MSKFEYFSIIENSRNINNIGLRYLFKIHIFYNLS